MNWRLLDVRVGRANRQQLIAFLAAMMLFSLTLPMLPILTLTLPVLFYLNVTMLARRLRDAGYSGWFVLVPYSFLAVVFVLALLTIVLPPSIVAGMMFTVMAVFMVAIPACSIIFLLLLIAPGSLGENKYGAPPSGLNFKTMVHLAPETPREMSGFHKKIAAERTRYKNDAEQNAQRLSASKKLEPEEKNGE